MIYRLTFAAFFVIAQALPAIGKERLATPEAFVRNLYSEYGKENRLDSLGQVAPKLFTPKLLSLIRADEQVPPGGIGKLDEDPLCDCQDDGGFRLSSVTTVRSSQNQATITTHMIIGGIPIAVVLDLVQIGNEWRVADVHSRSISSLISFLSSTGSSR